MSGPTEGNLNSTTPAAPSGKQNVIFQTDAAYTDPVTGALERDITAYPQPATASLEGTVKLAGDLGGTTGDSPKVAGIQGIGVSVTSPTNGQVLQYNSGSGLYVPVTLSGAGGATGPTPSSRQWAYGKTSFSSLNSNAGVWVGDTIGATSGTIIAVLPPGGPFPVPVTQVTTAASLSATGGFVSNAAGTSGGWTEVGQNFLFQVRAAISAITSIRMRLGVGELDLLSTWLGSDTLTTSKYAAFRFSTNVPDTDFQCECGNGSAVTVSSSGIAAAASTLYTFQIQFNDSVPNVVFSINGTVVATITTDLPASGTGLAYLVGIENLSSSSRQLWIPWIYEECDN